MTSERIITIDSVQGARPIKVVYGKTTVFEVLCAFALGGYGSLHRWHDEQSRVVGDRVPDNSLIVEGVRYVYVAPQVTDA